MTTQSNPSRHPSAARTLGLSLVCGLAALWLVAPAHAEVRRLEAIGTAGISDSGAGNRAPRDAAIRYGLREAVSQVAMLLLEQHAPEPVEEFSLDKVMGRKLVNYTSRFRVLEDRGLQPAVFQSNPEITTEYVVVLEVDVDVDRVRDRLEQKGLIPAGAAAGESHQILINVRGLHHYPAYEALRALLVDDLDAVHVVPVALASGRARIEVETLSTPKELLDAMLRRAPPELQIEPLGTGQDVIHLAVQWVPPDPAADAAARPLGGRR